MEPLSALDLEVSYRSDTGNLVSAFYVPCMKRSVLYRRGVGYFTSHGLAVAAQGIAHLVTNGGKIRLVASPLLSEEDQEAITNGYEDRKKIVAQIVVEVIRGIEDRLIRDRLNALAWLISNGCLDIRLAICLDSKNRPKRGIYHEKIGIFSDGRGNHAAFVGSPNETAGGLVDNFESIDVFWSWDDSQKRVARKIIDFDRLWNNHTKGLEVLEFPDVLKEALESYRTKVPPRYDPLEEPNKGILQVFDRNSALPRGSPRIPSGLELLPHQLEAKNSWFRNNGRGTLKMATGAGKTIASLAMVAELWDKVSLQTLIVICPFRHLVLQWGRECERFGLDPILAFQSQTQWADRLSSQLFSIRSGTLPFLTVVTTNHTFSSTTFQSFLRHFPKKTMLVGDEAHNLGSKQLRKMLPTRIVLRLALSATPERWFDDTGTQALFDYFGPILQPEFTLADALKKKVLVPYDYHPILVPLTSEEGELYLELSAKIAQCYNGKEEDEENPAITSLLMKRARLIGVAKGKLQALRELMRDRLNTTHTLFYCGDGSVEEEMMNEPRRQVEEVTRILGKELRYRVASYTFETPLDKRDTIRIRFESGKLQGLVAIRCLDEGMDIPIIKTAVILASSRNPRQFIQRRGRILRKAPGKEKAEVFDMIVVPPIEGEITDSERSLMRNELIRQKEFAELATNAGEALQQILPLQYEYGLLDI